MTRMEPSAGGFGGVRVVKPQANVYTVLLLVACLLVGVALGLEIWRWRELRKKAESPRTGSAGHARPAVAMVERAGPIFPSA